MTPVLILMTITFHLQIISGIGNGNYIGTVRVQRGKRVILKCVSSGVMRSWLGPDFSNLKNEQTLLFFSNHLKNPKLSMSKYSVQARHGNYDLIISNFQEDDTGLYICRCFNDHDNGTFKETKYTVTLVDEGVESTTIGYERRTDLGNAPGIQVKVKETSSQFEKVYISIVVPANQRHSKPNSELTITLVVVFLLVISMAILGLIARRKWGTLSKINNKNAKTVPYIKK
ncbi:unnamed protein product [Mytilus edulis]|uniref:Ig-like domain-containing protein n=1 Tax=Mytilus edulis TaxID=6550 RepID=A0A8S3UAY9_MYTED|nr:unnamed protein product [Mytilus edulis]